MEADVPRPSRLESELIARIDQWCRQICPNENDADELRQEVYQKLLRIREWNLRCTAAYAWRAVRTCRINSFRKRGLEEKAMLNIVAKTRLQAGWTAPSRDDSSERRDALNACVRSLRVEERVLLKLFYYDECSVREVAAILEKSTAAVNSAKLRLKVRLKRLLTREGFGPDGRFRGGDD